MGFTCHSGIGSEYWQPYQRRFAWTMNVPYSEILYLRTFAPLIFYEKQRISLFRYGVMPQLFSASHYPLEGGTSHSSACYSNLTDDLKLFDRESEGHLILATHPDVDTNQL